MTSMFDQTDDFLTANSALFSDLTENDLLVPEKIVFLKDEVVVGEILDVAIIERIGAIKVELKLLSGEHLGKLFDYMVYRPKEREGKISPVQKRSWASFLLAFFTREEILSQKIDFNKFVGRHFRFKAALAREYNGKVYQEFYNPELIEEIPF